MPSTHMACAGLDMLPAGLGLCGLFAAGVPHGFFVLSYFKSITYTLDSAEWPCRFEGADFHFDKVAF